MRNAQERAPRLWEAQPKQAICRKRKLSILEKVGRMKGMQLPDLTKGVDNAKKGVRYAIYKPGGP